MLIATAFTVLGSWAFAAYPGAYVLSKATLIAVKTFCKSFLTLIGTDYLVTDAWYKREQAILNVHNTTSVRATFGEDGKNSIVWGKWNYKTFETQKPYLV